MRRRPNATLCTAIFLVAILDPTARSAAAADDLAPLLEAIERGLETGAPSDYIELVAPYANLAKAGQFATKNFSPGVTRAVVLERDRALLRPNFPDTSAGIGYRVMVEVFLQRGASARVETWRLEVRREEPRPGGAGLPSESSNSVAPRSWRIADQETLTALEGLVRLELDSAKQYAVHDLTLSAEDMTLTMARGSAFVASTAAGVTAVVLLGTGELVFSPEPAAERGQLDIFSGAESLRTPVDAAFIRLNPHEMAAHLSPGALSERAVDEADFRRARAIFDEYAEKSFGIDLGDLTGDTWWFVPSAGNFLAEIRTRRFGSLTYVRSAAEAEDVSLFDRKKKLNISSYASRRELERRGRFYDEDAGAEFDVLDYDIEAALTPEREWIAATVHLRLRALANSVSTLKLRLAESLEIESIDAGEFGRVPFVRGRGQKNVIVSLPSAMAQDEELVLGVRYAGRLPPQSLDGGETIQTASGGQDFTIRPTEPRYLYTERSSWYPQAPVSDYATARIAITLPAGLSCVASGMLAGQGPDLRGAEVAPRGTDAGRTGPARRRYEFKATRPLRYLAVAISRFSPVGTVTLAGATGAGNGITLSVQANPRQRGRGRDLLDRTSDITAFYASLLGDLPYPSFTLAVTESDLPGGHSPAYFALLDQPLPGIPFNWNSDPVHFPGFPDFFLAHEIAHQWWGQAVGWKNYHEQWLSEGMAQYFAALYAEHRHGKQGLEDVLRQMRRSAMEQSSQGPVYLGYRLGHLRGDSRVFRSLVYNKSAIVLHMLRRFTGDDAFFRGIRRFYRESRFRKAGSDDLRRAMEAETTTHPLSLERFFERWIYSAALPTIELSHELESTENSLRPGTLNGVGRRSPASAILVRLEQLGDTFDLATTITVTYSSGETEDLVVPIREKLTEIRIPLAGDFRSVEVNRDHAALAEFVRKKRK